MLVLKELHDLSDPQTADALKYDLRWKIACGRSLLQTSFDPSTLVYWRKRIAASDRPDRVFDAVAEVIAQTGILRGRRKRCVDSTVFDDAVATQDTVTQLTAAMRKVSRVVPGAAAVIADGVHAGLREGRASRTSTGTTRRPRSSWSATWSTTRWRSWTRSPGRARRERDAAAADALGLLALVAGQDVEPAEGCDGTDGRWRIARKVAPDRVISTVDPEARHTRKSKSKRRDGFRGHVAAEPETGLVTDCEMTMAAGPGSTDAENGVKMACRDRFAGDSPRSTAAGRSAGRGTPAPGTPRTARRPAAWRSTATPPTAPGTPAPPTATPGTAPSSSPGRCARPCPAGSPSTTSPSTRTPARSPARPASPGR